MNDTSYQTAWLLAISMLRGVGPATLQKILAISDFYTWPIEELAARVPQIYKALQIDGAWLQALEATDRQLFQAEKHDARILSPLDEEYPVLLAATKDDPVLLYVCGELSKQPEKSVAIIGTREPTLHGRHTAIRISEYCVEQGWSVVSGLAIGCDGIAHQATLDAGGHTVAVLAHGLHTIAPRRHAKLAEDILASGGALISQFKFGAEVMPQQYVIRDKVQAGLAKGVIMVQSDIKGGSLHASRAALDYRRWLAVPYPTSVDRENNEPKVQANLLIAEGDDAARAKLLHCSDSALESILVLRGREDYPTLSNLVEQSVLSAALGQSALI